MLVYGHSHCVAVLEPTQLCLNAALIPTLNTEPQTLNPDPKPRRQALLHIPYLCSPYLGGPALGAERTRWCQRDAPQHKGSDVSHENMKPATLDSDTVEGFRVYLNPPKLGKIMAQNP